MTPTPMVHPDRNPGVTIVVTGFERTGTYDPTVYDRDDDDPGPLGLEPGGPLNEYNHHCRYPTTYPSKNPGTRLPHYTYCSHRHHSVGRPRVRLVRPQRHGRYPNHSVRGSGVHRVRPHTVDTTIVVQPTRTGRRESSSRVHG